MADPSDRALGSIPDEVFGKAGDVLVQLLVCSPYPSCTEALTPRDGMWRQGLRG